MVWGSDAERGDFLKVPRALLRLGSYSRLMGRELQPRHILLALNLASRRFRDAPLIVEWKVIARDLGVRVDTVRHWAYELRDLKLITIGAQFVGEPESRRRGVGVEIDISAFVELVGRSVEIRREERQRGFEHRQSAEAVNAEGDVPF